MSGERRHRVRARYYPIRKITVHQIRSMYDIFSRYYDNVSLDMFTRDMSQKTGLFLLWDRDTGKIVGFSTLTRTDLNVGGRKVKGVFSGDTVLEKEYWGTRALAFLFYIRMVKERLKNPFRPVFWLLISKGYKTYLLLANNFSRYYPDPDGQFGWMENYVQTYCRTLFPESFCSQRKLLDFGEDYTRLKGDVTPITEDMRRNHPKIRFFEQRNPTWQRGTELPCIGLVGYRDVVRFPFLLLAKRRRPATPAGEVQYE